MAKYTSEILCGFDIQTGLGTYNAALAAITAAGTWDGDSSAADEGLLLGDADSGINGSGLTLTMSNRRKEQVVVDGSLTRPISKFEASEVSSFSFLTAFGGNLSDTTVTTPVDGDFVLLRGLDTILRSLGMVSNTTSLSPGIQYRFSSAGQEYLSALLYVNKNEIHLQDCVANSAVFTFAAGKAPTILADFGVGVVDEPSSSTPVAGPTYPTEDYGLQRTVSPAIVESVVHTWEHLRGFSNLVITITNTVEKVDDSNVAEGFLLQVTGRETKITATMYDDDASENENYTLSQLLAETSGVLDPITFQVGTTADGTSSPAEALSITIPQPELISATPTLIGTNAAYDVEMIARHSTLNREIDFDFV